MISYQEALALIAQLSSPLGQENVGLSVAHGRVLAEALHARVPSPCFTNSAMDGFAFAFAESDLQEAFTIVGEIFAASDAQRIPNPKKRNAAVRIMTGAPLPEWADTVVPVEFIELLAASQLRLTKAVTQGENVRHEGEDLKAGEELFASGTLLTAERVAVAAALGHRELTVWQVPRLGLFATGDELQEPGAPLPFGAIYDSNSYYLAAAARELGLAVQSQTRLKDDVDASYTAIGAFLKASPTPALVLTSGAVSAGDKDFIPALARDLGFKEVFHKVAVRPGKPVFLAQNGPHLWLGIPGNPVSTMTSWQFFARPVLHYWGKRPCSRKIKVSLAHEVKKPEKFHCFYRAIIENRAATMAPNQGSAQLRASLVANSYVELPVGVTVLPAGSEVEAIILE